MAESEFSEFFFPSLRGSQLGGASSAFVLVEWSDSCDSGYESFAPLHVHHADDEAWYVLEGQLRFRIGDEIRDVGPHGAVLAPMGTTRHPSFAPTSPRCSAERGLKSRR